MIAAALQVRVVAKRPEALDICSFELESADGHPLPAFAAGSHIDVDAGDGITRQYSLCNDPAETHRYRIAVLKDAASRGGSRRIHENVEVGDVLRISAPKNHFALAHSSAHSVLLAGGIGITPILCMAQRLSAIGGSFELHYCTRDRERTAFAAEIQQSAFTQSVKHYFSEGAAGGQVDLAAILSKPAGGKHLYVCGPKRFMDATLDTARRAGWTEEHIHYELFGGAVAVSENDGSFEVKLASSGRIVVVRKDQTVVQALARAGVDLPVSCEQGVCGTCLTRVIDGSPDHRDMYLTANEQARNDQFTPCCSRSLSPCLVLDL